ncbi:MAG: hypothetical protein LBR82_00260 [Desulfovibrio sp.]|jgi:hypothetical protein|nr:hypothetical protein [Desulfovibrio sp.]
MKNWRVEQARPEYITDIAERMREADRREVWAFSRHTPEQALRTSLERSQLAWTAVIRGRPELMWGVAAPHLLSSVGQPWMLATDAFLEFAQDFLLHSRRYVREMLRLYTHLENYVHGENAVSIRWLQWCGFSFDYEAVQVNGEDFYRFWRFAHV